MATDNPDLPPALVAALQAAVADGAADWRLAALVAEHMTDAELVAWARARIIADARQRHPITESSLTFAGPQRP